MRFRYSDGKTFDTSISLVEHRGRWTVLQITSHFPFPSEPEHEVHEFTNRDLAEHDFRARVRIYLPLLQGDNHANAH